MPGPAEDGETYVDPATNKSQAGKPGPIKVPENSNLQSKLATLNASIPALIFVGTILTGDRYSYYSLASKFYAHCFDPASSCHVNFADSRDNRGFFDKTVPP